MLQPRAIVNIADNSGGKIGRIFKVLGGSRKRYAGIGEVVVLSVQKAEPRKTVKKKDIHHAVIVRSRNAVRRADGSYIRFDENAVVLVDKAKHEPIVRIPPIVRIRDAVVQPQTIVVAFHVEDVRVAVTICVIVCSATRGTAHVICLRKRHQAVFYL